MKCGALSFLFSLFFLTFFNYCAFANDRDNVNPNMQVGPGAGDVIVDSLDGKHDTVKFSGNIVTGAGFAFWQPGLDDEKIIEFKTEGLKAGYIGGNLVYDMKSFLSFGYERPLSNSSTQEEIFKTNTSMESGLEKFTGGIILDPFADVLFPNNVLLRKLFSVKFKYTKEVYFGEVTSLKDFVYVPQSATVDSVHMIISGFQVIPKGESVAFRTKFIDYDVSLPLWSMGASQTVKSDSTTIKERILHQDVRLGYFSSEWSRPSHGTNDTLDRMPVVSANTYKVHGILVAFETQDPGMPGWNLDWSLRYGFNGTVKNAFNYKDYDVRYLGVSINTWYNLYFGKDRNSGWLCTLGLILDRRRLVLDADTENDTSERILEDEDDLIKPYMSLSYRF